MNKTKKILWITLVLVWSFLAGAYFQLGYNREASLDFQTNFLIGGFTLVVMFLVIGFIIYRIAKKFGSQNPLKPTLIVLTLFTAGILVNDLAVYDKVQKVNFLEDHAQNFVQHFSKKAKVKGLKIKNLNEELKDLYFYIGFDLRSHPEMKNLMQLTSDEALFEKNQLIKKLCKQSIKLDIKQGNPPPKGLDELFD